MRTLYNIDPHSTVNAPFLFREIDSNGKLRVRDCYREFSCPRCGKIKEEMALTKGIPPGVVVKSKRPFIFSAEFIHLVDARGKAVFVDLFSDKFQFFEIPSTGYWAAMAKENVTPFEGDLGYRFQKKCPACGRFRDLIWDRAIPAPVLRSKSEVVSIRLEWGYGVIDSWYVSKEYADRLETVSPPLTGLVLTSKEFTQSE